MIRTRRGFPPAFIALGLGACGGARPEPAVHPAGHPLSITMEAGGIERLAINGRDGRLDVSVGADQTIRVRVDLDGCGAGHRLAEVVRGSSLVLEVTPSTKAVCDQRWVVEVPRGMAVAASLDRADVAIEGTSGGVDVRVGKGTVRLNVPGGALRARVDNGDVVANTGTSSYGAVEVESEVGRVEVSVDGGVVGHERAPGSGDRLTIDSSGRDRISLKSIVGNVSLAIRGGSAP